MFGDEVNIYRLSFFFNQVILHAMLREFVNKLSHSFVLLILNMFSEILQCLCLYVVILTENANPTCFISLVSLFNSSNIIFVCARFR